MRSGLHDAYSPFLPLTCLALPFVATLSSAFDLLDCLQCVLLMLLSFHVIWSKMFLKRLWRITRENLSDTFVKEDERRDSGCLADMNLSPVGKDD